MELPRRRGAAELFSSFLMWLLADLFQDLPRSATSTKRSWFFFFETQAHLLFKETASRVRLLDHADRAA